VHDEVGHPPGSQADDKDGEQQHGPPLSTGKPDALTMGELIMARVIPPG
jgi:hypothetical protein